VTTAPGTAPLDEIADRPGPARSAPPLFGGRAGAWLQRAADAFTGREGAPEGADAVSRMAVSVGAPSETTTPAPTQGALVGSTPGRRPLAPSAAPGVRPATAWRATSRRPAEVLLTVVYAVVGFAGVLVVVASAPVWRNAAPAWRLTVPGIPHPPDGSIPAVVLVLWAVPPVLGTPILSNDVYSYAAQGEMATRGIDPTSVGPYALSRGPFLNAVDPIWRDAPAPYGPVAITLSAWAVDLTGNSPAGAVWAMRGVAVAGVAMTAVGVVLLARRHRVPAASALIAGVAGPLVLLHMIGGSHNDALMMGLLTLGMAAFSAHRRVLSVVLVVLAVAVKLPAAVALPFIGWNWHRRSEARPAERVATTAGVGAGAGALLLVLSAAGGIGFGWLTALSNTGSITSTFSVSTKLGLVAADVGRLVGLGVAEGTWVSVFRLLGLLVAAGICAWLLIRSPRIGVVRAVGMALVVSVLLGPVVWPWYLPAGLALLAATGLGRWRPTFLVVVMAASTFVWPTSVNPVQSLTGVGHILGLGFLALVALVALAAQHLALRTARWRADRLARQQVTLAARQRWMGT
jgi:alpha-1,6-mannosyltransferase